MATPRRLLLRNIYHLVLADGQGTRLRGADLMIDGSRISDIGPGLPRGEAEVIDCSTKLVLPGFVNTHHHMHQSLQRCFRPAQNAGLFEWLKRLYPVWQHLTAEAVHTATQLSCAELLKTGCTTTADHHYLFPKAERSDLIGTQLAAAQQVGIRFCAMRGSMSVSERDGGLPPEDVVQDEDTILEDCERVIAQHHDPDPFSMCRVALAPCAPFSVSPQLMVKTAELAREHGVGLHTHLAETRDEESYCLDRFGCRPLPLMERWGWLGADVWFAHAIHLDDDDLALMAQSRSGVAHCPSSNMRLGSGFCRVPELLDRGVRVGLGVDGSASNDSSDMLGELRSCLFLHRVRHGAGAMDVETALSLATVGGARVLGWETIGSIQVGQAADLAIFEMDRLDYAGASSDPLAAIVLCGISHQVDTTIVNGKVVVRQGRLVGVDEERLRDSANRWSRTMLEASGNSTEWVL